MPPLVDSEARDIRRTYVEYLVATYQADTVSPIIRIGGPAGGILLPSKTSATDTRPINKVAVVGGGVAGLRAAMMLGSNFNVDLYEAGDECGGRLFTHHFEGGGEWDYFDVGAMRFPKTELMKPVFDLFKELDLELPKYHILDDNNRRAFNLQTHTIRDLTISTYANDPFKVGISNGGTVPDHYAKQNPGQLLYDVLKPLIELLLEDRGAGFKRLKELDYHTTRSYLRQEAGYPPALIDYIETMSYGTGWFDRALAETVFEELCFQYDQDDPRKLEWYCVKGGSSVIIKKMRDKLEGPDYTTVKINTKHRVTAAVYNDNATADEPMITISGLNSSGDKSSKFSEGYSHVIFALPPPCLRTIDLSTCHLDYEQRNALRMVSIGPSCKIGIKFKTAWWNKPGIDIKGGQSTTDRMARTIVYPSYGDGKSTVLIASYSWTQDAVALGAWIQGRGTAAETRLKELMLADLAYVHKGQITLEELEDEFDEIFPFDWTHNPNTMGAFGVFGPDQFRQYYCALTRPAAGGHMHFVGEAISTIHGWVAGALESAGRGVMQVLELNSMANAKSLRPTSEIKRPSPMFRGAESLLSSVNSATGGWSVNSALGGALVDAVSTFAARVADAKDESQVDKSDLDPLVLFQNKWDPDVGVNPELLTKQLAVSRSLQVGEFGLSPAFKSE
ncbi:unnamed protein product [Rhizoctonia solani]|uniref:Amine oxidase domain-containing protein n=1 Tax=Rhizoctonia solani TaxID=456999 RepID=A0A8H3BLF0_9AGAM|nr:unnamed protein product [Rhizoctonia solani]